ncbi:MAG: hypothetical protein ACR2OR_13115 [Hyphomicrobiales bacterium]
MTLGETKITANDKVTGGTNGIDATASGAGKITVIAEKAVLGKAGDGINADSKGGAFEVTAKDTVEGQSGGDGIEASTTGGGTVKVTADKDVKGDATGILTSAENGATTVSTDGKVEGVKGDGIKSTATGFGAITITTDVSKDGGEVIGALNGIVTSATTGKTTVIANDSVDGTAEDGIQSSSTTGEIDITAKDTVTGGKFGIDATSTDAGNITVLAEKAVFGKSADGINADSQGGYVSVTAKNTVTGEGGDGIEASTTGGGTVDVTTEPGKLVLGKVGNGILISAENGKTTILAQGPVEGQSGDGIEATSTGGEIDITAKDTVTGSAYGIDATATGFGKITVLAEKAVLGKAEDGINADSQGANVSVTAKDTVTGEGGDGIEASTTGGGAVDVTTEPGKLVLGKVGNGILTSAENGETNIEANGSTEGSNAGILANSTGGAINITNNGQIENYNGRVDDPTVQDSLLAIETSGGPTTIDNNDTILGFIKTGALSDVFNNLANWITGGTSDFGGGDDTLNNFDTVTAANQAGVAETTVFNGLEQLNNSGVINLSDQIVGDNSTQFDRLETSGNYNGNGGELQVDAFLGGPGSKADVLAIGGNTSGLTNVTVIDVNSGTGALNPDGIPVVEVGGSTAESHFQLTDGPIEKGLFIYDLFLDGQVHELQSRLGLPAFEPSRIAGAVQNASIEATGLWFRG